MLHDLAFLETWRDYLCVIGFKHDSNVTPRCLKSLLEVSLALNVS
jgi:hypothetical protein